MKKETKEALVRYRHSQNNSFKKYSSRPPHGIFYLVKSGDIILESSDYNLIVDASGDGNKDGIIVMHDDFSDWENV